jgi:hypothetical protein
MKIKYVGLKDSEDAFSGLTGVTWGPGVEHEIADAALAARMLQHPDVFALAETPQADESDEPDEQPEDQPEEPTSELPADEDKPVKPHFLMQTEEGPLVLDFLDKETLKQLAKEADIAVGNSGPDKIRQKLAEAFPVEAA